jgi:hypothetical protein
LREFPELAVGRITEEEMTIKELGCAKKTS